MITFTLCTNTAGPNPGKHFALTSDRQLAKETVGARNRLHMKTVTAGSAQHMADQIAAMPPEQHLMCGVAGMPESIGLAAHTAKPLFAAGIDVDEVTGLPLTGLTKNSLKHPPGGGLMVIDSDGTPPAEAWEQIKTVAPALAGAGCVLASSSSSLIYDAAGNMLRGNKGGHIYIGVSTGTDIQRTLNALHVRLWIGGFGRGELSKAGGFLERSPVDHALAAATQPVFVLATLSDDLHQEKQIEVVDGVWPIDTKAAVPDLSREELSQYAQAVAAAREALIPEQTERRRAYIEQRAAELGGGESAYAMVAASLSGGDLPPDFPINMSGGEVVAGRDILGAPEKYHRMTCRDPVEPDYGSAAVAMIFADGNGARIHSFAHGGRTFHLTDKAPAPVDLVEFLADMEEAELAEVQALRGDKELLPWLEAIPASLRGSAPVPLIGGDTAPAAEVAELLALAQVTGSSAADLVGDDVAPHAELGLSYRIEGDGVVRVELTVDGFAAALKGWKKTDCDGALGGWAPFAARTMNHVSLFTI